MPASFASLFFLIFETICIYNDVMNILQQISDVSVWPKSLAKSVLFLRERPGFESQVRVSI